MPEDLVAGRYQIQAEIGRGASATLFRAVDTVLGRVVALKAMSSALASDETFVRRFTGEARIAAGLDHPNIVTVYDVGRMDDGRPFISMKLVDGVPLDRYVAERPYLTVRQRVQLLAQVAAALDYLHAAGLVHRDVKPSNVLVDRDGNASLMDFGIAVAVDAARITLPGMTLGTPRYMSPEQVQGREPTFATDIYALAVVAYELLGGSAPFEGTGTGLMYRIVNEEPRPLAELNPDLGAASGVVDRALAKDATSRWPTAGQFVSALLDALPPDPEPATAASGDDGTFAAAAGGSGLGGRRPLLLLGGGFVLALVFGIGAGALFAMTGGDDEPPPSPTATTTPTRTPTRTPSPTPPIVFTPTPTFAWAEITGIAINGTRYSVDFQVGNFVPDTDDVHVHFFFDTVSPLDAGEPGDGPWILYDTPSPFTQYRVADRPAGAQQMCILVANPDHSVRLGTGNCVDLP